MRQPINATSNAGINAGINAGREIGMVVMALASNDGKCCDEILALSRV